ncbi:unnamed protein product [Sphenostylis stenocarpa]|uniref:Uncharacterized protein n=1 Tax=Sphenostylis stenocarpa TaxID=92480 RepID=A0AA86T2H3_9FABA|nr:unnamed protein product [Sphenostylis stenocarpa]
MIPRVRDSDGWIFRWLSGDDVMDDVIKLGIIENKKRENDRMQLLERGSRYESEAQTQWALKPPPR